MLTGVLNSLRWPETARLRAFPKIFKVQSAPIRIRGSFSYRKLKLLGRLIKEFTKFREGDCHASEKEPEARNDSHYKYL